MVLNVDLQVHIDAVESSAHSNGRQIIVLNENKFLAEFCEKLKVLVTGMNGDTMILRSIKVNSTNYCTTPSSATPIWLHLQYSSGQDHSKGVSEVNALYRVRTQI